MSNPNFQVQDMVPFTATSSSVKINHCHGCNKLIVDQYLLQVGKGQWHEECVKCESCGMQLYDKCYEREGKLYCKTHYYRIYSPYKCNGCHQGVSPTDMVYKLANGLLYHTNCHRCIQCGRTLHQGEEICVDENNSQGVACVCHYKPQSYSNDHSHPSSQAVQATPVPPTFPLIESTVVSSNGLQSLPCTDQLSRDHHLINDPCSMTNDSMDMYSLYSLGDDPLHGLSAKNYLKRRGPRTTIKHYQLDVLNRTFDATPKPSKHARAKLALETGLSMRVIQVWFQNRRSKERRLKHLCNWIRENESRGLIPPISPHEQGASTSQTQNTGISSPNAAYSAAMLNQNGEGEVGSVASVSMGMESDEFDIDDDDDDFDEEDGMFLGVLDSMNQHARL